MLVWFAPTGAREEQLSTPDTSPPTSASSSAPATDQRLPRTARLRKRAQFLATQGRGVRHHGRLLIAVAARGAEGGPRLGITASKKVGNAVARNRAKRLLRECFRRQRGDWPDWLDLVVIARHSLASARLDEVAADLRDSVARALENLQRRGRRRAAPPQDR